MFEFEWTFLITYAVCTPPSEWVWEDICLYVVTLSGAFVPMASNFVVASAVSFIIFYKSYEDLEFGASARIW